MQRPLAALLRFTASQAMGAFYFPPFSPPARSGSPVSHSTPSRSGPPSPARARRANRWRPRPVPGTRIGVFAKVQIVARDAIVSARPHHWLTAAKRRDTPSNFSITVFDFAPQSSTARSKARRMGRVRGRVEIERGAVRGHGVAWPGLSPSARPFPSRIPRAALTAIRHRTPRSARARVPRLS